ncbi:hypothetical protein LuPra_02756 [Luteitalea pratensis]|uniref:Uncharacterized protein n=1 Tax=Luteitalea pratensis TaxID=1855912 RepID=A0A143PLT0_LUTPR|nr:hypothetical protein [Luteitalea pratensis]AMY09537.1 hypothetical protein LuPra_02756 [Luteitalea pratensis]
MRNAFICLCIFTAACSGQTSSPTSPSGVAGGAAAQTKASGGTHVEVTFTKWITGFPAMAGVTGGSVPGTFVGTVLSRDPFENGTIVQLEARYEVTGADSAHSFVAHITGKTNNPTQKAVLNGTVIGGWLAGAQIQVTFDVIVPPTGTSCVPQAPVNRTCFQGTIRVLPGAAS